MPADVRLLHDALQSLQRDGGDAVLDLGNCGTAMRFLTAYCAGLPERRVVLDGCERMRHRPIGQLVDVLRRVGADIRYLGEEGFPPLEIHGRILDKKEVVLNDPLSTQFVSALLLVGIPVRTDSPSPYISLTRACTVSTPMERDWSCAAFWYEYVALHGGELLLCGLQDASLQGDRQVSDLFACLGVTTVFTEDGTCIRAEKDVVLPQEIQIDFASCPDLYPAVAVTCACLGIRLHALGTASLRLKESDRLQTVNDLLTGRCTDGGNDHRIAMAALAADLPCSDIACVGKSYPMFVDELKRVRQVCGRWTELTLVVPRRGINDDNLGKKHALHKLITVADTDYVWLTDDDTELPMCADADGKIRIPSRALEGADLVILPLRMRADGECPSLVEKLQMAEYAAIQQLTVESARYGHPVMCSGANLIVRRDRWLESYGDLHPEIVSGDDMFLLESFKRRGLSVRVADSPCYEAVVRCCRTGKELLKQRMRWAGKAPHYTDKDIILCGAAVALANILQILCPPVLLVKFPIEYRLIKKRDRSVSLGIALLLEVLYPFYMLLCLLGGLFRRRRW